VHLMGPVFPIPAQNNLTESHRFINLWISHDPESFSGPRSKAQKVQVTRLRMINCTGTIVSLPGISVPVLQARCYNLQKSIAVETDVIFSIPVSK
jgi:hypothetical protein